MHKFGADSLGNQPRRAGSLVYSSQFLQKSRFLWVSEGQGRGRQSFGEKKVNILPLCRWSWHRSLFFAGPLLLAIERAGFLDPVSFLTNRNWHDSSQTQRFPLLSKPEAPELGKALSRPWESVCVQSAVCLPPFFWEYFPR